MPQESFKNPVDVSAGAQIDVHLESKKQMSQVCGMKIFPPVEIVINLPRQHAPGAVTWINATKDPKNACSFAHASIYISAAWKHEQHVIAQGWKSFLCLPLQDRSVSACALHLKGKELLPVIAGFWQIIWPYMKVLWNRQVIFVVKCVVRTIGSERSLNGTGCFNSCMNIPHELWREIFCPEHMCNNRNTYIQVFLSYYETTVELLHQLHSLTAP